jgi:hypothetical protein
MPGYHCTPNDFYDDHQIYPTKEPFCHRAAGAWLIQKAAWRPWSRRIGGIEYIIKRGQLLTTVSQLAGTWNWDQSKVRRFLAAIERASVIGLTAIKNNGRYLATIITLLVPTTAELTGPAANPPGDDDREMLPCPPEAECGETGPFLAARATVKQAPQTGKSRPKKPDDGRHIDAASPVPQKPAETLDVSRASARSPTPSRQVTDEQDIRRNKEEGRNRLRPNLTDLPSDSASKDLEDSKSKYSNEYSLNARADAHAGAREGVRSLEIINRDLPQPSEPHSDGNAAAQLLLVGGAVSAAEETPNQPFPRGRARGRRGPVGGYDVGITQGMVAIWNEECGHFATVLRLAPKRHKRLLALFRDEFAASYDRWREYCSRIAKSDYLSGRVVHKDGRTWRANIDWAIKPDNVVSVLEDYYDQTAGQANGQAQDRDSQRRAQVDAKDEDNFRALCSAALRAADRAAVAGGVDAGVSRAGQPRRSPYSTSDL